MPKISHAVGELASKVSKCISMLHDSTIPSYAIILQHTKFENDFNAEHTKQEYCLCIGGYFQCVVRCVIFLLLPNTCILNIL